ncbi:MAG: O-antigen ligase family protein [Chitinispirillaceae bacterium]|nr:O-antigen ligase family protein [Chitinispirillaceae bacterium]
MNYFIIALFLTPLTWRLFTNYKQGVYWSIFMLVALSANPVLITGAGMPNFNLQRLILIVLLIAATTQKRLFNTNRPIPFIGVLVAYAAMNILPLVFSIDLPVSIKAYLSFTVEIVLFYTVISASVDTRREARMVVLAGVSAFLAVAVLAIVERYTGFNPVDAFMPGYVRKTEYVNDILSTFPHRILLGTAMAMGWPLALAFAHTGKDRRWIWWICICLLLLSCYFSFSRGPWLAAMFGGIVMFLFAGAAVRRQTLLVMALIAIALFLRPGVLETLTTSAQETADTDSFKGQTYQYRWELWGIAWDKVSRSSERLLFGFGQGSTEVMTFDALLTYTGETTALWSWDNHYAATLLESGLVGLAAFTGLYSFFLIKIFSLRHTLSEEDKTTHAAIMAAITVMLFMMTNVAMFAPQLNYLVWSLIAAGLRLGVKDTREERYDGTVTF